MANDKSGRDTSVTSSELEYILEVNKKAVTIYSEVGHQNEEIIAKLNALATRVEKIEKSTDETHKSMKSEVESKVKNIDKNLFRLVIILSSTGVGLLFTIIQSLWHH